MKSSLARLSQHQRPCFSAGVPGGAIAARRRDVCRQTPTRVTEADSEELRMKEMNRCNEVIWTLAISAGFWLTACGGGSNNNASTSTNDGGLSDAGTTGGAAGTGGSRSVGGTSAKAGGSSTGGSSVTAGGTSNTGGNSAAGTGQGGLSTAGGNNAAGGSNAAGNNSTGGVQSAGGSTSVGGTSATSQGGLSSVGGSGVAVTTGGISATGGSVTAGGVSNTGGLATGGITAAAGASATGGVVSTGGAPPTTGGAPGTGGSSGSCGADGASCTLTGGALGICQNNVCTACASGTQGNTACSAAYGAGTGYVCASGACVPGNCVTTTDCTGGTICGLTTANVCGSCSNDGQCRAAGAYGSGYLCASGSCVSGNCKVDTDCTSGQICGLQIPYTCSGCSADGQCQNDPTYGAGTVCNTTSSICVSATCTRNNAACTSNMSDFCCAGTCTAGNCCITADCATLGNNYTCTNHTCSLCPQATANTYYVDPVNGNDSAGTGSNASAGCAFKTISRAIAFIGATLNAGTLINVLPTGTVSATSGEIFPIQVPTNTTVSGSGGTVTVQVPAANVGFVMTKATSGLTSLAIDGQANTATNGIAVAGGSVSLTNLTVSSMLHDGIHVTGAATLNVGAGVSSTQNGTTTTGADGLHVSNTSTVTINVTSGAATHFDNNSAHGIFVNGTASIALTGTPGTNGTGTVTTNGNTAAGIWIEQTPGATLPLNTISGLVSWANQGNGIRIVAGSAVQLRNSIVLANAANGVLVSTNTTATPPSDDTSKIDLGTTTGPSYGKNTLQASLGSNPNSGAGICLQLTRNAGSVLNAAGNIFAGPVDCSEQYVNPNPQQHLRCPS